MMHIDDFEFKIMSKEIKGTETDLSVLSSGGQEVREEAFLKKAGLTREEVENLDQFDQEQLVKLAKRLEGSDHQKLLNEDMKEFVDVMTIQDKIKSLSEKELEEFKQNRHSSKTLQNLMIGMLNPQDSKLASQMLKNKQFMKMTKQAEEEKGMPNIVEKPKEFKPIQLSDQIKQLTQYLKVPRVRTKLPAPSPEDEGKITVFIELDQILCYSFLPDETMGSITNPAVRDPDHTIFIEQFKQIVYIYKNDGVQEFLSFLNQHFEPILFTSGHIVFVQKVLEVLKAKDVFRHVLHQDNCSLFQKDDQDIYEYVKQIDKYLGEERSIQRSVLIDANEFNCIFNPDNADKREVSESLQMITQYLSQMYEHVESGGDVRVYLEDEFHVRQMLQKSKLL